ncbi:TPA: glycoside hydrolase family 1 protein [Candidatus Taylorbacteria bacterium]|nr:glycoside hydrolase family 1 protein [Candidatus Taylorbacteria bacterium]
MKKLIFPKGFLWGASSSSHQVEGNTINDWTVWEKSQKRTVHLHSHNLTREHKLENFISGRSADHYNLFKEDFTLASSLGHNATRISLEWSRIEPAEGSFDQKEIDHYKEVIATLRKLNIEPFVTLWHWPIPIWLANKGGWESKEIIFYFKRFVEKMVTELPEVKFWLTLNEPEIYSFMAYLGGVWPPQKKNLFSYIKALRHLKNAHNEAYDVIKKINPKSQVSIAFNLSSYEPVTFIDRILVKLYSWWRNDRLIRQTRYKIDFIGLNYYFHSRIHFGRQKNLAQKRSDVNWHLHPEKILFTLRELKKYDKPIYITENGLADAEDSHRKWFITESLMAIHQAIDEGVDVKGYLHWSLTDNFEWHQGFWPKFGLIKINYETLEREVRQSARFYEQICKNNYLEIE